MCKKFNSCTRIHRDKTVCETSCSLNKVRYFNLYTIGAMLFLLLFLDSCTTIKLSKIPENKSFCYNDSVIAAKGQMYFKRPKVSIWEKNTPIFAQDNDIVCDGKILSPFFGGDTVWLFGYERTYYWKGDIRLSNDDIISCNIEFIVRSSSEDGGAGADKYVIFKEIHIDDTYSLYPSEELKNVSDRFEIPCEIAKVKTETDVYEVYAVYADTWFTEDGSEYQPYSGTVDGIARLLSSTQKFQILNGNDVVVADLENSTYRIFGTPSKKESINVKQTVALLYSIINIQDIVSLTTGWL